MKTPIPLNIQAEELLIRGIVHPMFYSNSKGKLKREAFIPPPQKQDVSILRRLYAPDDSFCKNHCKSIAIGDSTYCGMATFLSQHVDEVNIGVPYEIAVSVKATPIDENENYVGDGLEVFLDSLGLPMHADLLYNVPTPPQGQPATLHRVLANKLVKLAVFYLDESPQSDYWDGEELTWKPTG